VPTPEGVGSQEGGQEIKRRPRTDQKGGKKKKTQGLKRGKGGSGPIRGQGGKRGVLQAGRVSGRMIKKDGPNKKGLQGRGEATQGESCHLEKNVGEGKRKKRRGWSGGPSGGVKGLYLEQGILRTNK